MKFFKNRTTFDSTSSDASLVSASLEGDQQAFGVIVTRYQRLLCSLAYSSIGSVSESEDVAQETFIEAWKKLNNLREPEKLKAWLCGILRFKISHFRRKDARQPVSHAEELLESDSLKSDDENTEDIAMKGEEKALLWQALQKVPETYREPLVLYYREHRSIEHVACELDLTEDAVKQRLSRGRKMLQAGMMRFVEDALVKSTPGHVFTMGVLGALVSIAPQAKAATVGATAFKVGSWFKWVSVVTFLATVSGLVSSVFAVRANLDQSRTKRERKKVVQVALMFIGVAAVFVAGMFALKALALPVDEYSTYYAVAAQALAAVFAILYVYLTVRMLRNTRALRAAERLRRPDLFENPEDRPNAKRREYRSRLSLLGIPLVHAKLAMPEQGDGPAIGWIAAGDRAYGLLFAWGGFAVAPISVGIVSFGVVTVGAVGIGVLGMGTVGIGFLAMGASAFGYKAYSSLSSMGWESAVSAGFSVAKEGAVGPIALANEANNEVAGQLANLGDLHQTYPIVLAAMALLVIVPVVWYSKVVRKRMGQGRENVD